MTQMNAAAWSDALVTMVASSFAARECHSADPTGAESNVFMRQRLFRYEHEVRRERDQGPAREACGPRPAYPCADRQRRRGGHRDRREEGLALLGVGVEASQIAAGCASRRQLEKPKKASVVKRAQVATAADTRKSTGSPGLRCPPGAKRRARPRYSMMVFQLPLVELQDAS